MPWSFRRVVPVLALGLALALGGAAAAQASAPVVTSISPNNGAAAGGTQVAIAGSGFTAGSTVESSRALQNPPDRRRPSQPACCGT